MLGSRFGLTRRVLGAVFAATFVVAGAAVSTSGAAPSKAPAKAPAVKATGTPVKVGFITTGGDCDGCGGADEEPAVEAAVKWLNATQNGLAGHPIELVTCVAANDPGKAADCGNQMVREGVVAVVEGSSGTIATSWKIVNDAGIPFINHSTTDEPIMQDADSTFILYDPLAQTVTLPIEVAKERKAKKVSVIVIDVPAATTIYETAADKFEDANLELDVVPVAIGTPDMSTQAQQIQQDNPDGVVSIVGHDAFCIPALNALNALGYEGAITTISFCITDAMREAVPPAIIEGMQFGSEVPAGSKHKSMKQYAKILKKYGAEDVDPDSLTAATAFQSIAALSLGTKNLEGEVTPDSVIAAMKSMDNEILPASGGRRFRCNGKASDFGPSICARSTVSAVLDEEGNPKSYKTKNNKPIPD
jgi:branched-chain amino acid transport system substrate-binding protein